jgi:hypothetical protein
MARWLTRVGGCLFAAALLLIVASTAAQAMSWFAAQTGQPRGACHVGAFGSQLTPFGQAFKIGGYTQTGGERWPPKIALAAFISGPLTHTNAPQPVPSVPDFGRPSNAALVCVPRVQQLLYLRRPQKLIDVAGTAKAK